jgi:16S rRNA G1207 methylase RsmC
VGPAHEAANVYFGSKADIPAALVTKAQQECLKHMRRMIFTATVLLLGCAKRESANQQNLVQAANQSTPEAAQVLNGAAQNGMDKNEALNEAAAAQASNTSTNQPPRLQARPNSAANAKRTGQPPEKVAVNSQ